MYQVVHKQQVGGTDVRKEVSTSTPAVACVRNQSDFDYVWRDSVGFVSPWLYSQILYYIGSSDL